MLLIARDHLAGGDATRPDGTRDVAIGELLADIEQRCFRLGTARPRALADLEGAVTLLRDGAHGAGADAGDVHTAQPGHIRARATDTGHIPERSGRLRESREPRRRS